MAATGEVLVLGFGGAGASAAIAAHEAGAKVTILEKMPEAHAGGNTRVSGNVWYGPEDARGAETYLRHQCGDKPIPEPLLQTWAQEATRTSDWLRALGFEVMLLEQPYEYPELPGHESDRGYHHVAPAMGMGRLYEALKSAVQQRAIPVRYATRARELLVEDGRVVGVKAEEADGRAVEIRAGAVVIATGGFANDPELARTYLRLPVSYPWGSPASTGDGLRMAQKAGADLANMDNYMGMMGLKAPEHACGFNVRFRGPGWILVDPDGRRFINEAGPVKHGKIRLGRDYAHWPGQPCFAVFDETTRLAGPINPPLEDMLMGWTQRIEGYRWSADNAAELARGWVAKGDTPLELAARLGVDADRLAATIAEYNQACAAGRDGRHGRDPATLAPLKGPLYGFAWGPLLVFTNGGPRKDERARVLDPFGAPIPGLYAAGEVASTYSNGISGGEMIADALCFGRIAGREGAAEVRGQAQPSPPEALGTR